MGLKVFFAHPVLVLAQNLAQMQVVEAFEPFKIQEVELGAWRKRPVKNNFFELVLIKQGAGTQCINYNVYDYSEGSLFLLPPLKCHSFEIATPT